jgi:hypothetical protein
MWEQLPRDTSLESVLGGPRSLHARSRVADLDRNRLTSSTVGIP